MRKRGNDRQQTSRSRVLFVVRRFEFLRVPSDQHLSADLQCNRLIPWLSLSCDHGTHRKLLTTQNLAHYRLFYWLGLSLFACYYLPLDTMSPSFSRVQKDNNVI